MVAHASLDAMLTLIHGMQKDCVYALMDKDVRMRKEYLQLLLNSVNEARGLLVAELRYLEAVT